MGKAAQRLRALIDGGEPFIAADAYSALTGRIVEHVGFPAAYLGGHACSAFHYAIPDNGIFSQVEQIEQAARIAHVIDIPLIVDADTLGETVADAFHFTRRYERAGIAGIHVEDEVNPKHSVYDGGLIAIADMQARIDACARAREDPAFVLIARCDELYPASYRGGGGGSLDQAIARGLAYAEAGADLLVYPTASVEQIAALRAALPVPLCALGEPVEGTAFALYTGFGWMGAARLHLERARELFVKGRIDFEFNIDDKARLIQEDIFDDLIGKWARDTGRPLR